MAAKETGFFKGAGGVVWEMDLPLSALMGEQLAKQELVRVEPAGEDEDGQVVYAPYTGGPTPIAGGAVLEMDAKDVEIAKLRARLAELEGGDEAVPVDVETGDIKPPAKNAPKSEWVAFAVAQGMSVDEAEGHTKEQLIELFSG